MNQTGVVVHAFRLLRNPPRRRQIMSYKNTTSSPATDKSPLNSPHPSQLSVTGSSLRDLHLADMHGLGQRPRANALGDHAFDLVEVAIAEPIQTAEPRPRIGPEFFAGSNLAGPRMIERMVASRAWSRSGRNGTGSGAVVSHWPSRWRMTMMPCRETRRGVDQ